MVRDREKRSPSSKGKKTEGEKDAKLIKSGINQMGEYSIMSE